MFDYLIESLPKAQKISAISSKCGGSVYGTSYSIFVDEAEMVKN